MTETVLIYVTAPDREQARSIGRAIVSERLAACANVLPAMQSIYWWNGALEEADEAVLLLKTRRNLMDSVTARVIELHPYECPCVVALPIDAGAPAYLQWIADETAPAGQ